LVFQPVPKILTGPLPAYSPAQIDNTARTGGVT